MASPLLARSLVVLERATASTTPPLDEERPGRDTTPSACGDTDKRLDSTAMFMILPGHEQGYIEVQAKRVNQEGRTVSDEFAAAAQYLVTLVKLVLQLFAGRLVMCLSVLLAR